MANNIDLTISALECPLGTFQCSGRLIFRKEYTVLFSPKRTTSRFASLTLRTAHRPIVSLCFSPKRTTFRFASLSLRTPHRSPVSLCFSGRLIFRLRTETFFQKIPVFRLGLFGKPKRSTSSRFAASIEAHCAVSSETLMLQPLRGLRTPHRPIVSSTLAAAAALWLPCVRGAVRRSGLRGCPLGVRGKGKGPAGPFPSLRTESAFQAAPVFRSAYSASRNARPPAASRPPNPAPSSRLFSISRRSGLMAPLCKGSCPASSRTEGLPPD